MSTSAPEAVRAELLARLSPPPGVRAEFLGRLRLHFDPDQPRRPKGDPHGGEWTDEVGGAVVEVDFGPSRDQVLEDIKTAGLPSAHVDGLRGVVFGQPSGMPDAYAAYSARGRVITISPNLPAARKHIWDKAVLHEIGHHVHTAKLTTVAARRWAKLSNRGQAAKISAYARVNQGEHFAEAYRAYTAGGSSRERLRSVEPRTHKFMEGLMKPSSKNFLPAGKLFDKWTQRYAG